MEQDDASKAFDIEVLKCLELTDGEGNPNVRPLAVRLRDIHNLSLTVKFFGYELARRLAEKFRLDRGLSRGLSASPANRRLRRTCKAIGRRTGPRSSRFRSFFTESYGSLCFSCRRWTRTIS